MNEKRSRYTSSVKDKTPSMIDVTTKNSQENFVADFVAHCKEYDVYPLPKFIINDGVHDQLHNSTDRKRQERKSVDTSKTESGETVSIFRLVYETPKKMETLRKIECKDKCDVSICMLDALNTTMSKYDTVTVLRLPNCNINTFGVMQISQMLTNIGCLRDLNLDMNPNVQENYHLLCTPTGNLRYLSLKLCKISDEGIKKIANELKYDDPPNEPRLVALDLANNDISERGASYIASMLRTNRSLQSLVLTGNRICDEGVDLIIQQLSMFSLTHYEITELRRRTYAALIRQREKNHFQITEKRGSKNNEIIPNDQRPENGATSKHQSITRRSSRYSRIKSWESEDAARIPPSSSLSTIVGSELNISHPFSKECVPMKGTVMCTGNMELQHLNLSYNRLTKKSLSALINCLYYQSYMMLDDSSRGLLHVSLEGNDFHKEDDDDLAQLADILHSRRGSNHLQEADFGNLVPVESRTFRKKISRKATIDATTKL